MVLRGNFLLLLLFFIFVCLYIIIAFSFLFLFIFKLILNLCLRLCRSPVVAKAKYLHHTLLKRYGLWWEVGELH